MLQTTVITRVTAACLLAFTLSAAHASTGRSAFQVDFKTINGYMAIVPVSINGSGPLNFLLDTGTSRTMVSAGPAEQLALRAVDTRVIVGIRGEATTLLAHCNSVSMGGATVLNLDLTVLPKESGLPSSLSGILGEDFLENFDMLIDNRHHKIRLQSGSDTLEDSLAGERLPIRLDGVMDGQPTIGRLIVEGRSPELSRNAVTLLLDSGASSLVWFRGPQSLGIGAVEQSYLIAIASKPSNPVTVTTKVLRQLRVGSTVVPNVMAVAPPARPGADTDGLLPTSLFGSIFISHSQKFVIFDPSTKR